MGPGPQVSPAPKSILRLGKRPSAIETTSRGSKGWEIFPPPYTHTPTLFPPISVNAFYISLASGNPSF